MVFHLQHALNAGEFLRLWSPWQGVKMVDCFPILVKSALFLLNTLSEVKGCVEICVCVCYTSLCSSYCKMCFFMNLADLLSGFIYTFLKCRNSVKLIVKHWLNCFSKQSKYCILFSAYSLNYQVLKFWKPAFILQKAGFYSNIVMYVWYEFCSYFHFSLLCLQLPSFLNLHLSREIYLAYVLLKYMYFLLGCLTQP